MESKAIIINRRFIESVIKSWDLWVSIFLATFFYFLYQDNINLEKCEKIFEVCIAFLSIIFSVYYAAYAVLVASGDDEFIRFLEEDGSYMDIILTFRYTLILLFISLFFSVILYFYSLLALIEGISVSLMSIYFFFVMYALFAVMQSSLDAVKYSEYRVRFLKIKKNKDF
ncbi:MAG: hypothetical protein K4305_08880 [Chlorobium sp.]|uniref:hypothetical protein n=1 Tax=Chlorobium sp. TaxID=1095 RepID=UPI002F3EBE50